MKGGPNCHFTKKSVSYFVGCSEKASITSKLLMEMLQYMDKLSVCDNKDDQQPFGHHSNSNSQIPCLADICIIVMPTMEQLALVYSLIFERLAGSVS